MATLSEIVSNVKAAETPRPEERQRMKVVADELVANLQNLCKQNSIEAEVVEEGSYAKDTWLKSDKDLDVFLILPQTYTREQLATSILDVARKAVEGLHTVKMVPRERYADHPYIEAAAADMRVNVVPCFKAEPGAWKSATDRTPYHTRYVREKLTSEGLLGEVRVLKKFLKALGVYGADIKTGGFSGYLAELLTIRYGSFQELLENSQKWRVGEIIDLEGHYRGREEEPAILFTDPLIVIDPVDPRRNVASPLTHENFDTFRVASKVLLENPSSEFFEPPAREPPSLLELDRRIEERGTSLISIRIKFSDVPDVLWGQLYKTCRSLTNSMKANGFNVLRWSAWSDEKQLSILVFELESNVLPPAQKRLGPPVLSEGEGEFLKKYLQEGEALSGPWVENGRWVSLVRRRHVKAVEFLKQKISNGGKDIGVASRIALALKDGGRIFENEEILPSMRGKKDFHAFLAKFLLGKPPWLTVNPLPQSNPRQQGP